MFAAALPVEQKPVRAPVAGALASAIPVLGVVLWGALAPAELPGAVRAPDHLAETGLYADAETLDLDEHVIAFTPQYPLWTDGASKRRWILIPSGTAIDASDPDDWVFPVGTKVWKEFAFDGHPVETRYMERLADGSWLYAAYAWTADGRDAVLVGPGGRKDAADLGAGRRHAIPSVSDCKACHGGQPSPVLGFSALQLSPDRDPAAPHAGVDPSGVDLADLVARGLVTGLPEALVVTPPRIVARSPVERAALGYLHGNCGPCHNAEGPLRSLGLVLRHPVSTTPPGVEPGVATTVDTPARRLGSAGMLRIAPGRPDDSLVLQRVASRAPTLQMPPLGTAVADDEAVALLKAWISQMNDSHEERSN